MNVFIVIPTYNESDNLESIVRRVLLLHPDFNIIVVDDNSPDGTGEIADDLALSDPRVSVIHRPRKAGLGTAYIEGFKKALAEKADLIFEMDADFSHDPRYLKNFLAASEKADLVIGSRYINGVRVEGWRFRRLLLSKFANMYVSYLLVRPVWDFTAGFRCYRRKVLEAFNLDNIRSDGYAFQIEMTYLAFKHGFRVLEIPIIFKEREHGTSKISRRVVWEAIWLTIKCRASLWDIIKHLSFLFKDYGEFVEKENHYLNNHGSSNRNHVQRN
jgi:dolichol-phosphate mannosyltransferase